MAKLSLAAEKAGGLVSNEWPPSSSHIQTVTVKAPPEDQFFMVDPIC